MKLLDRFKKKKRGGFSMDFYGIVVPGDIMNIRDWD